MAGWRWCVFIFTLRSPMSYVDGEGMEIPTKGWETEIEIVR